LVTTIAELEQREEREMKILVLKKAGHKAKPSDPCPYVVEIPPETKSK
jgi:hypothetical protein